MIMFIRTIVSCSSLIVSLLSSKSADVCQEDVPGQGLSDSSVFYFIFSLKDSLFDGALVGPWRLAAAYTC